MGTTRRITFGCFAPTAMRSKNSRMAFLRESIHGRWIRGENSPSAGTVLDFQAGRLITDCDPNPGITLDGLPDEFLSDAGDSGHELLARLLRPPRLDELRYGAFREAVAFANSVALYGFGETRAWETKTTYIADTGEGSCGIVRFFPEACVAAMINYDPHRSYNVAAHTNQVPTRLRGHLRKLCATPMLNSEHQRRISAVFWSEGGLVVGSEPWPTLYEFGGEIFRREMLDDDTWLVEARAYYEPEPRVLETSIHIARQLLSAPSVRLSDVEETTLLPEAAPNVAEARRCLGDAGVMIRTNS